MSKQYDAASRGTVFCLTSPTSFLALPTHPKPSAPSLVQPFLVLQLALAPVTSPSSATPFSLHLALLSTSPSPLAYSLVLSSALTSVTLRPFGADLPLSLPSGAWLNVCIPVRDLLRDVLQVEYSGVESVVLRGQCKVRRVFGLRHAVATQGRDDPKAAGDDEYEYDNEEARMQYERQDSVPAEHDFEPGVLHRTLLYSLLSYSSSRRMHGQDTRRKQTVDRGREERAAEGRRRVSRASRATVPHFRSSIAATETPLTAPPHWEESIEAMDEFASAAPVRRHAASKSTTRTKRSTQPLPTRSLATQPADGEKRPSFHVPTSYQMVPYAEMHEPSPSKTDAPRKPASSPSSSRQLNKNRRSSNRKAAEDKPDTRKQSHDDNMQKDASAGLVFQPVAPLSAAGTPLSPSSFALPSRPSAPLTRAAVSELRSRSPIVRRQPPLIRTYTAPETIDVQHNVVGREWRDARGEERVEEDEYDVAEVAMERAGTAEVYRTAPEVREHEKRLEQRQHRRSRRKREERRGREDDDQQQQPQAIATSTDRHRTRSSVGTQPSFAFRPDLSSAESTPNSASATSSHASSRRASCSSSSISAFAQPHSSSSDLSSTTISLSSTPFTSLPSSPTIRSVRTSLIAHAATSHQSAPSSRRQSVQSGTGRDSSHQQRRDDDVVESDERDKGDEKRSQRRSSSTSRPTSSSLPRVAEVETARPATASPLTAATVAPAYSSAYPPLAVSVLSDEAAAPTEHRSGIASLFSSPSASIGWPVVSTGPSSPPPFSTLRPNLPPFSFISKLSETASSTPAALSSGTTAMPVTLPASVPVSSTTSPSTAPRPLSFISQPVSPSPAASVDWARVTVSDDARKAREKALIGGGSERAQDRVLAEIEEEGNEEDEADEEQAGEEELEAAENEDETTRDDSELMQEAVGDTLDASLHSDLSHHSSSSVSGHSQNNSSPTSARAMAVVAASETTEHARRQL